MKKFIAYYVFLIFVFFVSFNSKANKVVEKENKINDIELRVKEAIDEKLFTLTSDKIGKKQKGIKQDKDLESRVQEVLVDSLSTLTYAKLDNSPKIVTEEDKALEKQVQKTLEDKLITLTSAKIQEKQRKKEYRLEMQRKIGNAIDKKLFNDSKKYAKNRIYENDSSYVLEGIDKPVIIYKLPHWPFFSLFYMQKDLFQLDVTLDFASKAYSSGGGSQDISRLIFGEKQIKLEDILLAAKLVNEHKLAVNMDVDGNSTQNWDTGDPLVVGQDQYHYFVLLKDQPLNFHASTEKQTASINYARHFHKGDISFGFQVPFVRRQNHLKFESSIDSTKKLELEDARAVKADEDKGFYGRYDNLQDFVDNILNAKDITFNKSDTEVGIGDISTFINFEFDWRRCERLVAGLDILFPTARQRNTYKLWDPELGKGFAQISMFGAILFNSSTPLFNPHFFAKLTFGIPASLNRRIPKLKSYDGKVPTPGNKVDAEMVFGEYVYFINQAVDVPQTFENEPDSTVRNFADTAQKIKIRPSPEIMFRAGNMFEKFLLKNAFLDIFYDIRVKGKDYLGFWLDADQYNGSILTDNSDEVEHRIGLDFSYQFDENFRLIAGGIYSFAGRNVLKTAELNFALNIEF